MVLEESRLNARERFIRTLHFQEVDQLPLMQWDGYWAETLLHWHEEGLPAKKSAPIQFFPKELWTVDDYFGFERVEYIPIDFGPIPSFVPRVLEEGEDYLIVIDELGVKKKVTKNQESMPQYIGFSVRNKEDWERMKGRFDPEDPRRYPKDWSEELLSYYEEADHSIHIGGYPYFGLFMMARWLMGTEKLLTSFFTDSNLIKDIFSFFTDFYIQTSERAVKEARIDFVNISEDIAYKNGPLISPKLFQEFMLPCYERLVRFFRGHGVDLIGVDSDGDLTLLIPLFLKAGINSIFPLEVAAGMDAVSLREKYGKSLSLIGNIDKRALAQGKKAIRKEVESKVPRLAEEGGYIPSVDHCVPPNVSLDNFKYYVSFLKRCIKF